MDCAKQASRFQLRELAPAERRAPTSSGSSTSSARTKARSKLRALQRRLLSKLRRQFHLERLHEESPLVHDLFDLLRRGFSRSVSGSRLDADQHRLISRLRVLQRRRILEAVRG